MSEQELEQYKIIVIGDSGVGKSNLVTQFAKNKFDENTTPTIMMEYYSKTVSIKTRDNKKKDINISIWDTAGQGRVFYFKFLERFRAIANVYYKRAVGAIIVYDMTKKESFLNLNSWIKELFDKGEKDVQCILVGNKSDLSHLRQVEEKELKSFASKHGMQYFETSAKENINVDEIFGLIVELVYYKGHPITLSDVVNVVKDRLPTEITNPKETSQNGGCSC